MQNAVRGEHQRNLFFRLPDDADFLTEGGRATSYCSGLFLPEYQHRFNIYSFDNVHSPAINPRFSSSVQTTQVDTTTPTGNALISGCRATLIPATKLQHPPPYVFQAIPSRITISEDAASSRSDSSITMLIVESLEKLDRTLNKLLDLDLELVPMAEVDKSIKNLYSAARRSRKEGFRFLQQAQKAAKSMGTYLAHMNNPEKENELAANTANCSAARKRAKMHIAQGYRAVKTCKRLWTSVLTHVIDLEEAYDGGDEEMAE
ncbi:hypothetical protein DFH27DRAFT_609702 [Peziza echinospora]|nr:hypothetical protein DFH27DRAFT_609702 [Peziza echinospora]